MHDRACRIGGRDGQETSAEMKRPRLWVLGGLGAKLSKTSLQEGNMRRIMDGNMYSRKSIWRIGTHTALKKNLRALAPEAGTWWQFYKRSMMSRPICGSVVQSTAWVRDLPGFSKSLQKGSEAQDVASQTVAAGESGRCVRGVGRRSSLAGSFVDVVGPDRPLGKVK